MCDNAPLLSLGIFAPILLFLLRYLGEAIAHTHRFFSQSRIDSRKKSASIILRLRISFGLCLVFCDSWRDRIHTVFRTF